MKLFSLHQHITPMASLSKLQPVRGTHDLLPEEMRRFRFITQGAFRIAERYGYGEISTPVFEFSEVFHRTLGDTSDVVTKETYRFQDRGGEELTLRPEFTAGIARAFISGRMQDQLPLKFFYAGPAFRYERPQKGRQRQFHQLGVELLGVAEPVGDAETILLARRILERLGLLDKVRLEINTLGDAESRERYRAALVSYFTAHEEKLSADSRARLARNPLRILDSKDEGDQALIKDAPCFDAFLTPQAQGYFQEVTETLARNGASFLRNPRLVRGLDYYHHTVFEFTTDQLGAQGTVLAGGRYDGLIALMGGPATPGIGWAAGIERLMSLMDWDGFAQEMQQARPIAVVPISEATEKEAFLLAELLRAEGFLVEIGYKGNAAKRLKRADKLGAPVALILGEEEIAANLVTLKRLESGEQEKIPRDVLLSALAPYKDKRYTPVFSSLGTERSD
jgi:histidyl-tRNA synthetase